MKIKILCVGKLKENYYRKAVEELEKKISSFLPIECIEVIDERTPDKASGALEYKIKEIEGKRLDSHIHPEDYVISLCIEGEQVSTKKFKSKLRQLENQGKETIVFLIGGSLGLWDLLVKRSNDKISFSSMTFPHQMMRVLLLEQIFTVLKEK